MLSRLAESFFWLARNVERAETVARALDVAYSRSMELHAKGMWAQRNWRTAIAIGTLLDVAEVRVPDAPARTAIERCVFDSANLSSIVSTVGIARANAIGVRAELTAETWEHVNELYLDVTAQSMGSIMREGPSLFLRRVRDRCQAIAGVADATLLHVDGWNFLQVGRFIERGYLTARVLNTMQSVEDPWPEWQRLLEICCASVPFARASHRAPSATEAAAFLLFEPTFPRSIRFCTTEVCYALHRISGSANATYVNGAEKQAGRLRAAFDFADIGDVLAEDVGPYTLRTVRAFESLVAAIEDAYFPRVPVVAAPARTEGFIA